MLELRPDSGHVWLTPVDTVPESRVKELEKLLSSDELERANRFVFPRDRSLFVVAHAHIRRVLSKYRPLSPESWRFTRTALGRPFISNGGDADGLFFSLSHTRGMIASLISLTEHAGIDVEKVDGAPDFDVIARQYFSEPEYAHLMHLDPTDRRRRFYELWTLKEAYGKALGAGLSAGLNLVSFSFDGGEIRVSLAESLNENSAAWRFESIPLNRRYQLGVARKIAGPGAPECEISRFDV